MPYSVLGQISSTLKSDGHTHEIKTKGLNEVWSLSLLVFRFVLCPLFCFSRFVVFLSCFSALIFLISVTVAFSLNSFCCFSGVLCSSFFMFCSVFLSVPFCFFVSVIYFCISTLVSLFIFHVPFSCLVFVQFFTPRYRYRQYIHWINSTAVNTSAHLHSGTTAASRRLIKKHGLHAASNDGIHNFFFIDYGLQGLKKLKYDLFLAVFIWGKLSLIWE